MYTIHTSDSRGAVDFGWLQSRHSFSFGNWYNPERMGVGALRVLNDDWVAPGRGFGAHPHQDMEIISIPLKGALEHRDSTGNEFIVDAARGDIQRMSAGTGITHSEFNHSGEESVNFLQIWVVPDRLGMEPSYEQKAFDAKEFQDQARLVLSPDRRQGSLAIHQDAYFSRFDATRDQKLVYRAYGKDHWLYLFVIEGQIQVDEEVIATRDALVVPSHKMPEIQVQEGSQLLLMEVPHSQS